MNKMILKAQNAFASKAGEGAIGTAIVILTAVVLGAIILVAMVSLFNDKVKPPTSTKVTSMFELQ